MGTYIFDLDGTLCDPSHRLHHISGKKKDYEAFYEACVDDKPKWDIVSLFKALGEDVENNLYIVTGRSEAVKRKTTTWLERHKLWHHKLIMRPAGNKIPDHILKRSWLHNGILGPKEDIVCVFEDRPRVVDMWRNEGLTCLQVAEWKDERNE